MEKISKFTKIEDFLVKNGLKWDKKDENRPWGGFFVIEENDAEKFISLFFPHLKKQDLMISGKLSPKILLVAPKKDSAGNTIIVGQRFGNLLRVKPAL